MRHLLTTLITTLVLAGSIPSAIGQGTQIPEDDRRQLPPTRSQPPTTPKQQLLQPADFVECYNSMGRPEMAVVAVLNIEHGDALVEQRAFVDDLSLDLARRFSTIPQFRMVASGRVAAMREDPAYQQRVNANPNGASQLTAERLDADLVIILLCRPTKEMAGGVTEYACSFEILDNARGRQIGGRSFTIQGAGVRTTPNDRRRLIEDVAKYTTNEIVSQANQRCAHNTTPSQDNSGGLGVAQELTVTLTGDYQDQDIRDIVSEVRRLRSIQWIDPNPRISSNPPSVEFELEATKGGFDLGDELSAGIFMAIEKDAQFVSANATGVQLSIQDPIYSTWMGEETRRNKRSRSDFRDLYRDKGQPKVMVLVREVEGITDRALVYWYWHYAVVPAVETSEAAGVRNAGGEAVRNSFGRVLRRSARMRPSSPTAIGMDMQSRGVDAENMNNDLELFKSLQSMGIDYMVEIRGRIDLRNDRSEPMRFTASLFNVQTTEELALTDDIGCNPLAGDPVAGAECATDIGGRLAAQTLDMLRNTWLDEPDWMKVVITDANTAREADRIQQAIEAVVGVDYVSFLALGDRGMVLEVAHFGADRDIRKALEQGDLPFELEIAEGTTRSTLRLQLK